MWNDDVLAVVAEVCDRNSRSRHTHRHYAPRHHHVHHYGAPRHHHVQHYPAPSHYGWPSGYGGYGRPNVVYVPTNNTAAIKSAEDSARRAREEADRERRAKQEAERKAEAERQAKIKAERQAAAELQAKIAAEREALKQREAKIEAERRRQEAQKRAEEERKAKQEAQRKQEEERRAKIEAQKRAKAEAEAKERERQEKLRLERIAEEKRKESEARDWVLGGKRTLKQAVIFYVKYGGNVKKIRDISDNNNKLNAELKELPRQELLSAKGKQKDIEFMWQFPPPQPEVYKGFDLKKKNIVFCGNTGTGKSTSLKFVLGQLGFADAICKSVQTGVRETTLEARKFEIDDMVLWDIPGYGTKRIPTGEGGEKYIRDWGLFHFDLTIIYSKDRTRAFEVDLAKMYQRNKKDFIITRTHMDNVVESGMWSGEFESEQSVIDTVKDDIMGQIPGAKVVLLGLDRSSGKVEYANDRFGFYSMMDSIFAVGGCQLQQIRNSSPTVVVHQQINNKNCNNKVNKVLNMPEESSDEEEEVQGY